MHSIDNKKLNKVNPLKSKNINNMAVTIIWGSTINNCLLREDSILMLKDCLNWFEDTAKSNYLMDSIKQKAYKYQTYSNIMLHT